MSDIVIVNMMCTDVGKAKGAGWPLLRTAFEVLLRRFSTPREIMLLFVLRDKTDSPLDKLENQLKRVLNKMWEEITGKQAHGNAALPRKPGVTVMATSHYLYKKDDFLGEMDDLRQRIISHTSGERATERIAASGFAKYAETIWDDIKKDKDLNLPSYRIIVAELRCKEIANEKFEYFRKDQSWLQTKKDVETGAVVQGFGKRVDSVIDNYLSKYNEEAQYYAETKRTEISKQPIENLLEVVEPIYLKEVEKRRNAILNNFEEAGVQELKSTGELMVITTNANKSINEFRNQLKDVAVRQANWNHVTEQVTQLESEIMRNMKVMEAEIRCTKIFQEKYQNFLKDSSWIGVKNNVDSGAPVEGFGEIVSSLINTCLFKYDEETQNFDKTVRAAKRKLLNEKMLQVVEPIYLKEVEKRRNAILNNFKEAVVQLLESTGELIVITATADKSINEFRNQLKDVAIEQVSWNHPTEQVVEVEIRCTKIFQEKNLNFLQDSCWIKVKNIIDSDAVAPGFGKIVTSLIDGYLFEYDRETQYFDEAVKAAKRKLLNEKMLKVIEPTYISLLECMRTSAMENFKTAIAEGLYKQNNKKKRLEEILQCQIELLIAEIQDQFEDAAIKQANWNHEAAQLERLKHDICAHIDQTSKIIEKSGNGAVNKALKVGWMITATVGSIALGLLGG